MIGIEFHSNVVEFLTVYDIHIHSYITFMNSFSYSYTLMSTVNRILIVAFDNDTGGIGFQNNLLYTSKTDLKHFFQTTTYTNFPDQQNIVVMGKNTWNSIPQSKKPFKNRINVVFSSKQIDIDNCYTVNSLDDYIRLENSLLIHNKIFNVFVIGGESIYNLFLQYNLIDECICTHIQNNRTSCVPFDVRFDVQSLDKFTCTFTSKEWTEDDVTFCIKNHRRCSMILN